MEGRLVSDPKEEYERKVGNLRKRKKKLKV